MKNNAIFLHIPKTGGTFFRKVLDDLNLRVIDFGYEHADMERTINSFKYYPANAIRTSFLLRKNIDNYAKECFKFCFVRNPYSWYESYWRFMYGLHWKNLNNYRPKNRFKIPVDNWNPINLLLPYANDDFNIFLENVLNAEPAFLTKLYALYAKQPLINYVGRLENIEHDMAKIFETIELKFDKNIFGKTLRVNESKTPKPIWSNELKYRVYQSELNIFENYKYSCDGAIH